MSEGAASVRALADEVQVTTYNASQQLGVLRQAGVVHRRQRGRQAVYRIVDPTALLVYEQVAEGLAGQQYTARELFTEELVLITAPQHQYPRRGPLAMTDLRGEAFVSFPQPSGLRRILDDATSAAGFSPKVPFESTSLERTRGLVSAGLGIALVARSIADAPGPPVSTHSVDPDPIHRAIALIRRSDRDLTPAAAAAASLLV